MNNSDDFDYNVQHDNHVEPPVKAEAPPRWVWVMLLALGALAAHHYWTFS